jgi:hypothetical protein
MGVDCYCADLFALSQIMSGHCVGNGPSWIAVPILLLRQDGMVV